MKEPIQVLVVDDSAIVREILKIKLSGDPRINVIATAPDPYVARVKLERMQIDVVILDIEMPRMDGLTFLKYLMKYHPVPVIMVSSLSDGTNDASILALELGAVDIVPKPGGPLSIEEVADHLIEKIIGAAQADIGKIKAGLVHRDSGPSSLSKRPGLENRLLSGLQTSSHLIAIGASTGGTQALEYLFRNFAVGMPPVVAVIHMPAQFTNSFAKRLNEISPLQVKEAEQSEKILPATIYIAPGGWHTRVRAIGKDYFIQLGGEPKLWNQRPSVDILFESMASQTGRNSTGILLTGMGRDGASGLLSMRRSGAHTIAQDEASSIVFGMPKEAIALDAADAVLGLSEIPGHLLQRSYKATQMLPDSSLIS